MISPSSPSFTSRKTRWCFSSLIVVFLQQVWLISAPPALYTSAPSLSPADRYVATSFFHWYTSTGGQLSGPWLPLEGRSQWTGQPEWWKAQIKQVMSANIDVLYVHLIHQSEGQRINFFKALDQLRAEGYDTPRIAPFLDPEVIWNASPVQDLAMDSVKDELVDQYIRFFEQYFGANSDAYAGDYLARQNGRPILNTWHVKFKFTNVESLTRADVENRLIAALGNEHPYFNNGIYMVTTALNTPVFAFADEQVAQFEINQYFYPVTFNNITSVQLKGGYWDQNVRNPGSFLARDGGIHYKDAWDQVDRSVVNRIYIESWNEYDEGTGIYAVDAENPPYIAPSNSSGNTDTWSTTNDPFEYIKTTARGAALFNETAERNAEILWHNIPDTMAPGETRNAFLIVRNTGDNSWTGAGGYQLVQAEADVAFVAEKRVTLDDTQDEIPIYGGIFRGRPKVFQVTLKAPGEVGVYSTNWQMLHGGTGRFGEELGIEIEVKEKAAGTVILENLAQLRDGEPRPVSASSTPSGLIIEVSYDGSPFPPVEVGTYTVTATLDDPDYMGSVSKTLRIAADPNLLAGIGSFEHVDPATAATTPPDVIDVETFDGWRFFNVESSGASFSAEITDHASEGAQALRLKVNNTGPAAGFAFDQWAQSMHTPVRHDLHYIVSFDVAYVEGVTADNLLFLIQEFNEAGEFLGNGSILSVSATSTDYVRQSLVYRPVHPDTAGVGLFFSCLRGELGTTTVDIDNVQFHIAPPAVNGDFEVGAVGSSGGTEVFVDSTSFPGWRLFSVGDPQIQSFTGTLVDAGDYEGGKSGSRAIRLDVDNTGSPSAHDYGLDKDNSRIPVTAGKKYRFAFDAALIEVSGGSFTLTTALAEFDASGNFLGAPSTFTPAVPVDQTFHRYAFDYVVANPSTTEVFFAFRPVSTGRSVVLVDNVEFNLLPDLVTASLDIDRNGSIVEITWPETFSGWLLQSNPSDLRNPLQWIDAPGTDSKTSQQFPIQQELPAEFFRLRSP